MRRAAVLLTFVLAFTAVAGCGDDESGGGSDTEARLLDDPSPEECLDALQAVLDRIEIPDDFDPSDGVDESESAAAEDAVADAAEGYFDPNAEDHPCDAALDEVPPAEFEAFMNDIDPEIIAFLGSQATAEFEEIED